MNPSRKGFSWPKYFLLWFLALTMGSALLWLHYGWTARLVPAVLFLVLGSALGVYGGMKWSRWGQLTCSWCGAYGRDLRPKDSLFSEQRGRWLVTYECAKCGHKLERYSAAKPN